MTEKIKVTIANSKFQEFLKPYRYKIAYGGRAGGKSVSMATMLLLMCMEKPLRILCTREVQNSIKESVHHLLRDLINKYEWNSFFNVTDTSILGKNGSEFIFKGLKTHVVNSVKSIEAIDICWIEEGQTVSMYSFEILDPSIRKENSEIWISFNRFFDEDPVWQRYVKNPRPRTCIIKSNYYDVNKNLISKEILELAETDKQTDYANYLHIWEGEPKNDTEKTWLPIEKLRQAINRQGVDETGRNIIGVDVARFGDDRTVFFKRKGFKVEGYKVFNNKDIVSICNELEMFCNYDKALTVFYIDDTGVGGGVTDTMISRGYNVVGVNFGSSANDKDKYNNTISEMWGEFKELLPFICLPDFPELIQELNSRYYSFDNKYKFCIERKSDYKKRMTKSSDLADSLLLCFKDASIGSIDYQQVSDDTDEMEDRIAANLF